MRDIKRSPLPENASIEQVIKCEIEYLARCKQKYDDEAFKCQEKINDYQRLLDNARSK